MARKKTLAQLREQTRRLLDSNLSPSRQAAVRNASNRYINNAEGKTYVGQRQEYRRESWGPSWTTVYQYDERRPLSRSEYSGKSDAEYYAEEQRKSGRIPKSVNEGSRKAANGDLDAIKNYIRKSGSDRVVFGTADRFWNNSINGFYLGNDGELLASVYWQNSSTDGTELIPVSELKNRGSVTFNNGRGQRYTTNTEELVGAFKRASAVMQKSEDTDWAQREIDAKNNYSLKSNRETIGASTSAKGQSNT